MVVLVVIVDLPHLLQRVKYKLGVITRRCLNGLALQ